MAATNTISDQDNLLNDVSRQLASSRLSRRLSRGSSVQSCSQSRHAATARVEKPRSTHNSPRVVDRRRTTTIASKRYTTLEDHWNMMFGGAANEEESITPSEERRTTSRPVSWHPGSHRVAMDERSWADRQLRSSRDTDMSSDVEQFPMLDSINTQFQHYGYTSSNVTPAVDSYTTSPSWDNNSRSFNYLESSPYTQLSSHMQPTAWSVPDWVQMTQSTANSAVQTPHNFLPMQQSTAIQQEPDLTSEAGESIDSDKVLVGMGLYDPPEGYDSWFASGPQVSTGKGLKLEETWEPPEPVDDDDDDSDDDVDNAESGNTENADDASVEEPTEDEQPKPQITVTLPPTPAAPVKSLPQQQWAMQQDQHFAVNMSGRSFLFDEHETYTNEWWYHQLKQPRAQDATIGYGWL